MGSKICLYGSSDSDYFGYFLGAVKMKKIILWLVFITISYFVISTFYYAGSFNSIDEHSEFNNIRIYNNAAGTEDLDIDRNKGLLFISSTDRWKLKSGQKSEDGIYLLDLNTDGNPYRLKTTYVGEFHPHGISFLSKNGVDYLFVINHTAKGNYVEKFIFKNNLLEHLQSYENKQMCCPNDLVAVDLDKFYVTNDHGSAKGIIRALEDYLRLANSYILYFNGNEFSKVFEDLNYANGINVSSDGVTIYLSETSARRLSVLKRDISSGKLELKFTKSFQTGLDNITLDADGDLWIASHPKLLSFVSHARNSENISPSQVLKLTSSGEDDFSVEEVYLNSGEEISASSTALYYRGEVFVGVVLESKLLRANYQKYPK